MDQDRRGTGSTIAAATLLAGTLDILAAIGLTLFYAKRTVPDMLRSVASGPFLAAPGWGSAGALLGLAVHYALMAVMVVVFVWAVRRRPSLNARPIAAGTVYGLITYVVMNLIIVPLRFGVWPPKPAAIATQLFCHVALVGIPVALITARRLRSVFLDAGTSPA